LSFNKTNSELTFCGWITKESFLYRATVYHKDTVRERSDGSSFKLKADTFEIENRQLNQDFANWPELVASWHNYATELL
jgi:hypothetical protein